MSRCLGTLVLLLSVLQIVVTQDAPNCGKDVGGAPCANNLCCSNVGFCGTLPAYCGPGCQSGSCHASGGDGSPHPGQDTPNCGRDAADALCENNLCCSKYGYCGKTPAYCGLGCQSQCHSRGGRKILQTIAAQDTPNCGKDAGGATCANQLCCSQYGFCGTTSEHCGTGCQSNCRGGGGGDGGGGDCVGLTCLIDSNMYNQLFPNRDGIYSYDNFAQAAASFPKIGTEGDKQQQLREVAAFAAHVQQETAGLSYTREIDQSQSYCQPGNTQYPCQPDQKYFGRGPLQLSWNYNYGAARDTGIGADILQYPDIVAQNGAIAFRSAFWFWTRTDNNIPAMHDVMVANWIPNQADTQAGRVAGFGETINIINGGKECGPTPPNPHAKSRIEYYKQFCSTLGVDTGSNLDCASMVPYTNS